MTVLAENRSDNVRLAIVAIILAVLAFSFGDAVYKSVSASFSLWQIYVIRSLFALPILICIIKFREPNLSLVPVSIEWTVLRGFLLALAWVALYSALPHLQLAVTAAGYYTAPLFITLFAAPLTGDRVGSRGWFAIALGFIGVLVMLRPHSSGLNPYALLPIVAAILYALAMIMTRTKCRRENPMVLSLALNMTLIVVGASASLFIAIFEPTESLVTANPFLFGDWTPMGTMEWLAVGLLAVLITIGSVGAAIAYQAGPSSVVATFDYFYLVFAVLWGFLLFSEIPDMITVLGIAMIATAGLMAVRR